MSSPTNPLPFQLAAAVLGHPEALADIQEADAAYATGEVGRAVDAVRDLRS